jgi:hypothetical protein
MNNLFGSSPKRLVNHDTNVPTAYCHAGKPHGHGETHDGDAEELHSGLAEMKIMSGVEKIRQCGAHVSWPERE